MTWRRTSLPLTFAAVLAVGCTGEFTFDTPGVTNPGADAGGGGNSAARLFFGQNIDPMLTMLRPTGPCVLCHSDGTPYAGQGAPVLFGSRQTVDITYNSLVSSGFVGTTPDNSGFRNVIHELPNLGDSFCSGPGTPYEQCTQDELSIIAEWVMLENQ
jgi:hypothetical protein